MSSRGFELLRGELIGRELTVVDSLNKVLIGMHGKIIDETKQTLVITTTTGRKQLLKNTITIELVIEGKKISVQGKLLVGRPEDRVKKRIPS
ncbi:ribonuclease P protein subunit [Candidatus Woesearchaeota archaeon]|nr:ribonuclease P protein subunit [Candidatus Woesearchaeota archaeon]